MKEEKVNVHFKASKVDFEKMEQARQKKKMNRTDYLIELLNRDSVTKDVETQVERITKETRKAYAEIIEDISILKNGLVKHSLLSEKIDALFKDSSESKMALNVLLENMIEIKAFLDSVANSEDEEN